MVLQALMKAVVRWVLPVHHSPLAHAMPSSLISSPLPPPTASALSSSSSDPVEPTINLAWVLQGYLALTSVFPSVVYSLLPSAVPIRLPPLPHFPLARSTPSLICRWAALSPSLSPSPTCFLLEYLCRDCGVRPQGGQEDAESQRPQGNAWR